MAFDPYSEWLGIPAAEQPPNRYRLLDLKLFESHPDRIKQAAEKQTAILRKYASTPHAESAVRLTAEIEEAKACLRHPKRKRDYDSELRAKLALAGDSAKTSAEELVDLPRSLQSSIPPVESTAVEPSEQASIDDQFSELTVDVPTVHRKKSAARRPGSYTLIVLVVGIVGFAGVLWMRANNWQIHLVQADQATPLKEDSDDEQLVTAPKGNLQEGDGLNRGDRESAESARPAIHTEPSNPSSTAGINGSPATSGSAGTTAGSSPSATDNSSPPQKPGVADSPANIRMAAPESIAQPDTQVSSGPSTRTHLKRYLSDFQPTAIRVVNGWFGLKGNLGHTTKSGKTRIVVDGKPSAFGIALHPDHNDFAEVAFKLGKRWKTLHATAAIPENEGHASVTPLSFRVRGDGKLLWTSRPLQQSNEKQDCEIDVSGVDLLELRVFCDGKNNWAQAVWIDPYVLRDQQ